ncbi:MAG: lytic murein transglycosylase [Hyphomicrobiaceae bacterium]|nr:lytic murein transglycosylase [Hyphomicrobiaceae bacterium]
MLALKSACASAAMAIAIILSSTAVRAADCGDGGVGFDAWVDRFKKQAAGQGISQGVLSSAFSGVSYDPTIIRLDRNQRSFKLSFEEFYARRAGPGLINRGRALMKTHAATLARVEQRFGVPPSVVVAIWGLETNYGSDTSGKYSIVRSLATLAYDCRRAEFFRGHLMDAMRIVQRGDKTLGELRGGWAGEIGQTQFLPSGYVKYAVDFDGDGKRDLYRSIPDVLASTANFLKGHGWRAGQPWGPGTANYAVLRDWNRAEVYYKTIAVMSQKMAGGS